MAKTPSLLLLFPIVTLSSWSSACFRLTLVLWTFNFKLSELTRPRWFLLSHKPNWRRSSCFLWSPVSFYSSCPLTFISRHSYLLSFFCSISDTQWSFLQTQSKSCSPLTSSLFDLSPSWLMESPLSADKDEKLAFFHSLLLFYLFWIPSLSFTFCHSYRLFFTVYL